MTPATTWGVSGSFLSIGDDDYGRVTALFRYYPQGVALTGFSLGAQAGVFHRSATTCTFVGTPTPPPAPGSVAPPFICTLVRRHEDQPGAGVDLGYAWLLGDRRQIAVSLGFGVSRVLGGSLTGSSSVIPNARLLNIGIAF
jgi:hypothetical protein